MVLGCAMSYLAQPMIVGCGMYLFGPTNGGSTNGCWVRPNQWWFSQWFWVYPTCLAQPMVVQPMVLGVPYLFGPTNGGSTNGYWACYHLCTCLAQPMVVGCGMYLFGPTNGSDQLPVIEISQQGHRFQRGGQCWVSCS
jgi:hypothetical protein